jgi:hypothetical protein
MRVNPNWRALRTLRGRAEQAGLTIQRFTAMEVSVRPNHTPRGRAGRLTVAAPSSSARPGRDQGMEDRNGFCCYLRVFYRGLSR